MDERLEVYESKMSKSLENLYGEFNSVRAGRANPHILDRIVVDYYGAPTPLQQVANVSVPEPRMIQIQPWEASLLKELTERFPDMTVTGTVCVGGSPAARRTVSIFPVMPMDYITSARFARLRR